MSTAVMMSIRPQHTCNIVSLLKLWEIRKKFPIDYVGWVYIYCTKDRKQCLVRNNINKTYHLDTCYWDEFESNLNGKVVARFWCDKVEEHRPFFHWCIEKETCLTRDDVLDYLDSKDKFVGNPKRQDKVYAIHITKLEIFDEPKEISEFEHLHEHAKRGNSDCWVCHRYGKGCRTCSLTRAPQSWCYIEI